VALTNPTVVGTVNPGSVSHASDTITTTADIPEGEGCFYVRTALPGYSRAQLRISLKMTDQDVVERAAQLMEAPSVRFQEAQKANWNGYWNTAVYGAQAEKVMRLIRPHMGARRGAKIDEVLSLDLSHRK
jgi:hypothetical protein